MNDIIGTEVYTDGILLGVVVHIIVAPHTQWVTHFVIGQSQNHEMKVVPLDMIELQTQQAIILPLELEWAELPELQGEHYQSIHDDVDILIPKFYLHPLYYSLQTVDYGLEKTKDDIHDEVFTSEMQVFDNQRRLCGIVIAWDSDKNRNPMSLVIEINSEDHHRVHIPVRWISHTRENNLFLDRACENVMNLPAI